MKRSLMFCSNFFFNICFKSTKNTFQNGQFNFSRRWPHIFYMLFEITYVIFTPRYFVTGIYYWFTSSKIMHPYLLSDESLCASLSSIPSVIYFNLVWLLVLSSNLTEYPTSVPISTDLSSQTRLATEMAAIRRGWTFKIKVYLWGFFEWPHFCSPWLTVNNYHYKEFAISKAL